MPKYVEIQHTVEPHSECMLFTYLRDANGVPTPGVKIKIWAGPPPVGNPPYYVDDDPNSPSRRTDNNGRFQFMIGGPPATRTDFFVQPLDSASQPLSDPIQYTFLPGQAVWITVVMAMEPSGPPAGAIPAVLDLQLDPRLASVVGIAVQAAQVAQGQKYWKLVSAQYQDETQSGGNINIVCSVENENGLPSVAQNVVQVWPQGQVALPSDGFGIIRFPMSNDSGFTPERGEHGPYTVFVAGLPSDRVVGMGLPLKRRVQYLLSWRLAIAAAPLVRSGSRVTGNIQNAPANIQLTLASNTLTFKTTTDASGNYAFANLPAGTFALALAGIGIINSNIVLDGANAATCNYTIPVQMPSQALTHYLLFGSPNLSTTRTNLILALDYIARFAPTVGFDANEARNAQCVTIVGKGAVTFADEQALKRAGCSVRHIAGADSYEMEQMFSQLINSGNPYPSS